MTFYNVVSGILFLLAWQSVLAASDLFIASAASALFVLIFNEALNTSQLLEAPDAPAYTNWMKLVDSLCFVALSLALSAVSTNEVLRVQIAPRLDALGYWISVLVYWLLLNLWNQLAGQNAPGVWPDWRWKPRWTIGAAMVVGLAYAVGHREFDLVHAILSAGLSLLVLAYVLAKAWARRTTEAAPLLRLDFDGDALRKALLRRGSASPWMEVPVANVSFASVVAAPPQTVIDAVAPSGAAAG